MTTATPFQCYQIEADVRQDFELNMLSVLLRYPTVITSVVDVLTRNNFKHTLPSQGGGSVKLADLYATIIDVWKQGPVSIITVNLEAAKQDLSDRGLMFAIDLAMITNNEQFTATSASYYAYLLLQEDFFTAVQKTAAECQSHLLKMLTAKQIEDIEAVVRQKDLSYAVSAIKESDDLFEAIDLYCKYFNEQGREMELAAFEKLREMINQRTAQIAKRARVLQMLHRCSEIAQLDSRSAVGMKILTKAMLTLLNPTKDHGPLLTQLENLKL